MSNALLKQFSQWSVALSMTLVFTTGFSLQGSPSGVRLMSAAAAEETPETLRELFNDLETAANDQKLKAVRRAYHRDFNTSDGLNRKAFTNQLKQLWRRYPELDYDVTLKNWEQQGDTLIAETVTEIEGFRQARGREMHLEATLRSRQEIVDDKIVSQEILTEKSQVNIGDDAPPVRVNAPEEVTTGETFNFDVIVMSPLGDSRLMGTALEEQVTPKDYFSSQQFDLEVLAAGGLYRLGTAPDTPGQRWLSAIIVGDGGMTLVSQRLHIIPETSASHTEN